MAKSLDNPINWSFPMGTLWRVRIRLHLFFIIGGLVIVLREWSAGGSLGDAFCGMAILALLFGIVLAHEFGHCFGARLVGGHADEVLLWPLGGLAYASPPHTARGHLVTAAAGPAVNVFFLIITGTFLAAWRGSFAALPLNPFVLVLPAVPNWVDWVGVFFLLNLIILLFNLAPVFPLDGGRILQCLLWPARGFADATLLATGIGMVGAIVLGVVGLVSQAPLIICIAIFGYLTCWQQRQMVKSGMYEAQNEFGYDFSRGYAAFEGDTVVAERRTKRPSYLARRRAQKALARARREAERLEERRRQVERILDKVHREGMDSLTAREKHILQEETHRRRSAD